MNVKEAVAQAKHEILDLFADEKLSDIGLEEVELDDQGNEWKVTIGFSRPWDEPRNSFETLAGSGARRSYKIVSISNETERAISIKNREVKN